jgi:SNF2 family DNA or RNA helicase
MTKLIERIPGYSNSDMVDYCETLKKIILSTKEVKVGRGKAIETIKIPKYNNDEEVVKNILDSCEYYKSAKMEFRDYQIDIINKGVKMLLQHRFLYLAMEVRTGKTLTSLGILDGIELENVLFVTKKKAMSSIEDDYAMLNPSYQMTIINYESLHNVMNNHIWDAVILDEAHGLGAFAKPSERALMVKNIIEKCNPFVILLSGTPTPESYSQMYHQVYGIRTNPFREFRNFYKFAEKHVKVKQKKINGLYMNDYSKGLDSIMDAMKPYMINYSQAEAGFVTQVTEEILQVEMKPSTYKLIEKLKKDLVVEGKEEVILADTAAKLMMKVHQLCSGTIKFESGNSMVLDTTKAEFIKEHFAGCKIGIFYKFKEELSALESVFGDELTTQLSVFEDTDKNIALQIVSGREGISLRKADYLVYYNIDFSATSYWQSKDRMTTKERAFNHVYWVFGKDGIEYDIYKAVTKKMDYTLSHFKKDFYD